MRSEGVRPQNRANGAAQPLRSNLTHGAILSRRATMTRMRSVRQEKRRGGSRPPLRSPPDRNELRRMVQSRAPLMAPRCQPFYMTGLPESSHLTVSEAFPARLYPSGNTVPRRPRRSALHASEWLGRGRFLTAADSVSDQVANEWATNQRARRYSGLVLPALGGGRRARTQGCRGLWRNPPRPTAETVTILPHAGTLRRRVASIKGDAAFLWRSITSS